MPTVKSVLFICTHNSARSQMAEAFLNKLCGDRYEAKSAGLSPKGLDPYVVKAMAEVGIDLSTHRSKSIQEFKGRTFDYVVTVCDSAREECPCFPWKKVIHKSFPDPSALNGTEEEVMQKVREIRDAIRRWVQQTFCLKTEP
ncbi:MAG: arsenate reductase ArsC [Candidatus Bathyarchaeia archaeon]